MRILKFPFSTPFLSTKTEHSKLVLLFEPKILIPLPIIEVFCNVLRLKNVAKTQHQANTNIHKTLN